MNILMVIDVLSGGGAQRQFKNIVLGLTERGHTVEVFTLHYADRYSHEIESHNIKIHLSQKKSRFDLSPIKALISIQKSFKPTVVIAFLQTPALYTEIAKIFNWKTALIVSERNSVGPSGMSFKQYSHGVCHLLSNHVTANSQDYCERLKKAIPFLRKKCTTIYNGVEESFFNIHHWKEHDFPDSGGFIKICVVAATCTQQKGALELVEAVRIFTERQDYKKQFSIDWIGEVKFDSPYVKLVQEKIDSLNDDTIWRWAGLTRAVESELVKYDVLLLPSLWEGVPNTMCEAMAAGLPVIGSDVSDNLQILNFEKFDFCYPAEDVSALLKCIDRYISLRKHEKEEYAHECYSRARSLFSLDRLVSSWEDLCMKF